MAQYGSPSIAAQMLQQHGGLPMNPSGDTNMNGMGNSMNGMAMAYDQGFNNAPQDLWKMPMTLEWDWADMAGYSGGGGYEDGISMNGVLPEFAQGNGSGMNMNAMNGHRQ
jgi:hypothetical protein